MVFLSNEGAKNSATDFDACTETGRYHLLWQHIMQSRNVQAGCQPWILIFYAAT